jgi:hypothetical protein
LTKLKVSGSFLIWPDDNEIETGDEFMIGKVLKLHGVNLQSATTVHFGEEGQDRKLVAELLTRQHEFKDYKDGQMDPDEIKGIAEQASEISQILRHPQDKFEVSVIIPKVQNPFMIPDDASVSQGRVKTFTMNSAYE